MAHDEFNSGARRGFSMALSAIKNVVKQMEYPETHGELDEIPWQEQSIIYHAQKDILSKAYKEVKKEMEIEVDEYDY